MLFGLEIPLLALGGAILNGAAAIGAGGALAGVSQLALGAAAAGLGLGAGAAAIGNAGSAANPMIAGGYQAALNDAYNNAVAGSSNALNALNLPGIPNIGLN